MSEAHGIFEAMSRVGTDLKAVKMSNMQRFKARHIYDIYNMIQPLLAKNGVTIARELISEREKDVHSKSGALGVHRFQLWRFKLYGKDGSFFETTFPSESMDFGDKSASQCDAMAFKQMLLHTFLIPTEDMMDPDDGPAKEAQKQPQAKSPAPAKSAQSRPDAFSGGKNAGKTFAEVGLVYMQKWAKFMREQNKVNSPDYANALKWIEAQVGDGNEELPF